MNFLTKIEKQMKMNFEKCKKRSSKLEKIVIMQINLLYY